MQTTNDYLAKINVGWFGIFLIGVKRKKYSTTMMNTTHTTAVRQSCSCGRNHLSGQKFLELTDKPDWQRGPSRHSRAQQISKCGEKKTGWSSPRYLLSLSSFFQQVESWVEKGKSSLVLTGRYTPCINDMNLHTYGKTSEIISVSRAALPPRDDVIKLENSICKKIWSFDLKYNCKRLSKCCCWLELHSPQLHTGRWGPCPLGLLD